MTNWRHHHERGAERGYSRASQRLDNLIDACKALKPVETGVVYPLSGDALMGAVEAGRDGLITPVLIGPVDAIRALAKQEGADLGAWKIVDVPDPEDAAAKACSMPYLNSKRGPAPARH